MKRTYFYRLLITYSLIVSTLVFIVAVPFIVRIQWQNRDEIRQLNDKRFESIVLSCEDMLGSLFTVTQNVKNLNSLDLFALSSNDLYFQRMAEVYSDLQQLGGLINRDGYHLAIHKTNDDRVITNTSTNKLDTIIADMGLSPALYRTYTSQLNSSKRYDEIIIFTDESVIMISQKNFVDSKMIVTVYTSTASHNIYPDEPDIRFSFLFDDAKVVDLRDHHLPDAVTFDALTSEAANGLFTQTINRTEYKWTTSQYLNMTYYYNMANQNTLKDTLGLLVRILLLLAGISMVSFAIITLFSIKLYRPIDRLIETIMSYQTDTGDPLTARNEIEYMAQQVSVIRNQNQELVRKLDANTSILKEELIHNIIHNTFEPDSVHHELDRYDLDWLQGCTMLILVDLSGLTADPFHESGSILDSVSQMLREQFSQYFISQYVPIENRRVCFIIQQVELTALRESLNKILTLIDTAFQLNFSFYIGKPSESLEQLHLAYLSVVRLLENRRRLPIRNIYDFTMFANLPAEIVVYPLQYELELIEAVGENDVTAVNRLLQIIFSEYIERSFGNKEAREMILFALVNTINRILQQMALEFRQIADADEYMILEMKMAQTADLLKTYVQGLFDRIFIAIKSTDYLKTENLKESLTQYISDNISQDISLLNLAEHFGLSPNYMSSLFKSALGDNFKDHLSRARYEKAVEIIKADPTIKLATLSEKVGIYNVNTLIRIFKKYSGISPGQYSKRFL